MEPEELSWYKGGNYTGTNFTMPLPPESQRRVLGDFLRTHRTRLAPESPLLKVGPLQAGAIQMEGVRRRELDAAADVAP